MLNSFAETYKLVPVYVIAFTSYNHQGETKILNVIIKLSSNQPLYSRVSGDLTSKYIPLRQYK